MILEAEKEVQVRGTGVYSTSGVGRQRWYMVRQSKRAS